MYDKNPLINLIVQMFMIYQDIANKDSIIQEYDFKTVRNLELEMLGSQKLRKLDQILKVNKKISVDQVIRINRALGMLYSVIEINIRQ